MKSRLNLDRIPREAQIGLWIRQHRLPARTLNPGLWLIEGGPTGKAGAESHLVCREGGRNELQRLSWHLGGKQRRDSRWGRDVCSECEQIRFPLLWCADTRKMFSIPAGPLQNEFGKHATIRIVLTAGKGIWRLMLPAQIAVISTEFQSIILKAKTKPQ